MLIDRHTPNFNENSKIGILTAVAVGVIALKNIFLYSIQHSQRAVLRQESVIESIESQSNNLLRISCNFVELCGVVPFNLK